MPDQRSISRTLRRVLVLNQYTIVILVVVTCLLLAFVVYLSQKWVEQDSLPPTTTTQPVEPKVQREQFELAKLSAEIRQIRSDTSGGLFSLKLVALFVTVGGAVGGYLLGQSHTTKKRLEFEDQTAKERLEFENKKNIDAAYQAIVQELAAKEPLLRTAAAVKLGMILQSFPIEWIGNEPGAEDLARKNQLVRLTKQVLAASLAIEDDEKVLKTLTIALVLHKPLENDPAEPAKQKYADARGLDLSQARASDAYWARVDFSYSDFFRADSSWSSFRGSILQGTQFRSAKLQNAVLATTDCRGASFSFADIRNVDLTGANLLQANFEGAKVFGCKLAGAQLGENPNPDFGVDISEAGNGEQMITIRQWLAQHPDLQL